MKGLDERLADRLSEIKARLHKEKNDSLSSHELSGPIADVNDLPTDPNFGWHFDAIDIYGAWEDYTGAGITVGVIDDGFNYNHTDLDANYNTAIDWDARDDDDDAYSSASGDGHGTKVAGVIAAEANGTGAVGVAYNAEIAGFRIGYGSAGSIFDIEQAITKAWAVSDVVNSSWGYSTAFQDSFKKFGYSQAGAALEDGVAQGRGGLGTVFVFSAGNERGAGENVNYHNFQNSPYTIAVAATTSSGGVASFSNPGAALLVAAPGSGIQTLSDSGGYTSSSGTSFSAPIVSGVVALMLEANSELGYRDVQEILAYSAQYNDATNSGWQFNGADNWNGGGLHFNHNFGFGQVDATDAVRLAETWTMQHTFANQVTHTKSSSPNAAIPDGNTSGVSDTIHITQDMEIDSVQVDLQISHTKIGDLVVLLTSPDGTESVLVNRPGGSGNTANNINFVLTANNFWGESPVGDWKITVIDKATGEVGTLTSWSLILNGDAVSNDDTYVYNDDYATVADSARSSLSDGDGGIDTINAAQVSTDSFINLNAGTTSTLAGTPMVIAAGTVIENLFLGDGNDTAIGNAANNVILGGRGDDALDGGAGTDTAKFFGSLDNFSVTIVDSSTVKVTFSSDIGINEGVDTLSNFERFDFDGVVYTYDQLASMYGGPPANSPPAVDQPIADQATDEDAGFVFTLPAGTFSDADGDALALTATLSDGSALPAWLSFDPATGKFSGTPAQGDVGNIDIKVTVTDPSGDKVSDVFRVTVNNVNDTPVLVTPIADKTASEDAGFVFTLPAGTFTDEDGDALALTATLSDGSALPDWLSFDPATGKFSGTPAQGDIGNIDIKVSATDPSGTTVSDVFRLTVNNVNDAPVVSQPIADQSTDEDAWFAFTLPAGTFSDADGDALALTATLSDGSALPAWLSFDPATGKFSGTPAQGDVGNIDIKVTATDPSGAKTSDIFRLAVNNVNDAPVLVTPVADQAADEDSAFVFTLPAGTFSDADGDALALTATLSDGSALPDWLSFDPATGKFSGTPAQGDVGTLDIKVTATDPSGAKTSDIFRLAVNNVNDAPVLVTPVADQSAAEDSAFVFTLPDGTFTDEDGDALALTATLSDGSALPDWLSFDPATGKFSGTPGNGDAGTLDIKVTATDPSGTAASDVFRLSVGATNDAPVLAQPIIDQTTDEDAAFSFTLPAGTFSDADGDTLALAATLSDGSALPAWLSFDAATGTFSGTPENGDVGLLDIKVTATDPSGTMASDLFRLTVNNVNDAPVVDQQLVNRTVNEDAALLFAIPALAFSDVDGDELTLTATLDDGSALPDWLSFDAATRTFSGTPGNDDVGAIAVKVTATDPSGASASDSFTITVEGVNDAPELALAIADQAAAEDAPFSFTLADGTFTDVDDASLALTATLSDGSALPDWLSFDAATGTFSGTPGNGDVGSLDIKVTASDAAGASVSDIFRLAVGNVNDAPTVALALADQAAAEDAAFEFTVPDGTFDDADGDALTFSATLEDGSALPAWLSFDADTGTFSGTPENDDVGAIDIRITATDPSGAKTSDVFRLTVNNVNDAPVLVLPVADQATDAEQAFSFTVPADTFIDVDVNDSLALSATLADGSDLPAWMSFDPSTGTFSGTPAFGDVGSLDIMITARDQAGATASTTFLLSVTNGNSLPEVASSNADAVAHASVALTALFAVSDVDGDAVTKVDLASGVDATGHWELDGTAVTGVVSLDDGNLGRLAWIAGEATSTEEVSLRVFDGKEWSAWAAANVTATPQAENQPDLAVVDVTELPGEAIDAGQLFSFLNNGEYSGSTTVNLWANPNSGGHWEVDGVAMTNEVTLTLSQFANAAWVVGADGTSEDLWMRVDDGTGWSGWISANVTASVDANHAPLVDGTDMNINIGAAVMANDMFAVTDDDGDAMTQYQIWSSDYDTGHWEVSGVEIDHSATITADQFDHLAWVGGDAGTTEDIWVRAHDGIEWSDWVQADVSVDLVGTPPDSDPLI